MSEDVIRGLPLWKSDITVAPLEGGITNHNYRVTDGDAVYAARTGTDDPLLGIVRTGELTCTRIAADLGIAPRLAYGEPGVLVSAFIDGTALTPELGRVPATIERVGARLAEIHRTQVATHLQYFSAFQVARTYVRIAGERDLALPAPGDGLLAEVAQLEARIAPFRPAFCHNDLMPGNLLDDGAVLWVIDWEYGGIGHPVFDLAGFATNCELDAQQCEHLLSCYPSDVDPSEFRVMKAIACLRESLWAVVQGAQSTIDFDYAAYRDEGYAKYQRFRAEI